ncbi:kelch-like protein 17 [Babylonia areolata]|uniref:kelch-like protein 17 n=1 Tax=Babylonia areolata TaxID=304850 RepID=UPI003FCEF901
MNVQRLEKNETFCDVRFIKGNDCVYAHRTVLSSCSGFFQGIFYGTFSECQEEGGTTNSKMTEVELPDSLTIHDIDAFLTAIYTGKVFLSKQNIMCMTELACFLVVESVRNVCDKFMREHLSLDSCLLFMRVADRFNISDVLVACHSMLRNRFHDYFIHQEEMLSMPATCVKTTASTFKYIPLNDALSFLSSWVLHCSEEHGQSVMEERNWRFTEACNIVSCVRPGKEARDPQHVPLRDSDGLADVREKLLERCHPWFALRQKNRVAGLKNVLVCLAPLTVKTGQCLHENRVDVEFHVCVYYIQEEQWLTAGSTMFPEPLHAVEDFCMLDVACADCKLYFVERQKLDPMQVLDLRMMTWSKLDTIHILDVITVGSGLAFHQLLPIAIRDRLCMLASSSTQAVS